MKFRIFIFFVCVFCFNIVTSNQYQEFGHEYQQHPDRPTHANYIRNQPVYPAHSQSFNHALPSQINNYASHPEPQYTPHHKPETFVEKDPRLYENIAESSAQAKASHLEHKNQVYIPQSLQELPRPYPVDNNFEIHVSPSKNVYRPDYTQHVAKPWLSLNTYQPTVRQEPYHQLSSQPEPYHQLPVQPEPHYQPPVLQEPYQPLVHQEPYHQPIEYSETQPSVYQPPPPLRHIQPQHPKLPQHAQGQRPTPPQRTLPHLQPPHQQTYYNSQPSYTVPVTHAQAEAYVTSETKVADILAPKPEQNDYLESALLKPYQLDDLGNLNHVKSSDVKLEDNDNDIERTSQKSHNRLLDNNDNQNTKLHVPQKNHHFINLQTVLKESKPENIPPKNKETFYHPRFAYLNHKTNPTGAKKSPIEVNPVNPHHYRNPIVNHNYNEKQPDNILVNEPENPPKPPSPLSNTDDTYPALLSQHSEIYETSALKDKEVTLYDHDLHAHEQPSKKQPETKPYTDKIHHVNHDIPSIQHSKIPIHSTPTDPILINNPVSEDLLSLDIKNPKDSFDNLTPIASLNSNYDKPLIESDSNLHNQPEESKPKTVVSQKEDSKKEIDTEIDVTKANKNDDNQQTTNKNVSDNGDQQQKVESELRSTVPKDIAKQSPIEGSPLNVDSPTDDGTSTEDENLQNDDCTSGEADPDSNGDDEEATESENDINAVLLSSIDLWEKLFSKQPNMEFQAFNVVTQSPIVEKTSRLFAFPNGTSVEESVETVWEHKGDAIPSEIKITTIIKNLRPKDVDAVKSNKNYQD